MSLFMVTAICKTFGNGHLVFNDVLRQMMKFSSDLTQKPENCLVSLYQKNTYLISMSLRLFPTKMQQIRTICIEQSLKEAKEMLANTTHLGKMFTKAGLLSDTQVTGVF